jgi:hypothetical protein
MWRLVMASTVRRKDRAQQDIAGAVGDVVIATALVGAQDRQLVGGAERDDRLAWVDALMLPAPDRS